MMQRTFLRIAFALTLLGCGDTTPPPRPVEPPVHEQRMDSRVPDKALKALEYIDRNDKAPEGYEGGRSFHNAEGLLPREDGQKRPLRYREWDVNPHVTGKNRGAERLVTGSDGSAYYTADHYRTFVKIR
jgi:guanyl-specific ribonuclease Sa